MGKRGPQPAPTSLKLLRGERKDRLNDGEPLPAEGEVRPPAWLTPDALEVWAALAPDLVKKRVLTTWDVERFGVWCDAVVRRRRAAEHLDIEGEIVEAPVFNRNGEKTGFRTEKNPWWAVWKEAGEVVAREGARFGLSPSERAQLKVGDGRATNPAERFLTGG